MIEIVYFELMIEKPITWDVGKVFITKNYSVTLFLFTPIKIRETLFLVLLISEREREKDLNNKILKLEIFKKY